MSRIPSVFLLLALGTGARAQAPKALAVGTLEGQIVLAGDTRPIGISMGEALATVTGPYPLAADSIHRTTRVASDGRFRLGILKPGTWRLEVQMTGYWAFEVVKSKEVFTRFKEVLIDIGKTTEITVRLKPFVFEDRYVVGGERSLIDFDQPGTGLRLRAEDWSHLPIK